MREGGAPGAAPGCWDCKLRQCLTSGGYPRLDLRKEGGRCGYAVLLAECWEGRHRRLRIQNLRVGRSSRVCSVAAGAYVQTTCPPLRFGF